MAEAPARRRYDSPVRRQRAAQTRERIVEAGAALAHEQSSWDWHELTFKAVAARAEVGERTVYRHFPTERHLHEAIMARLNEQAGVDYGRVELSTVAAVARSIFESLESFAVGPMVDEPDDPAFRAVDVQRREGLLRAVTEAAPDWTDGQRAAAAGALDLLWTPNAYERLVSAWGLDSSQAADAITWLIGLIVAAVETDEAPGL